MPWQAASYQLPDGLIVQLEDYLKAYPDSRLIVIDTLQKIRTASKDNAYANDYGDISLLKDFADRHSLSVVVVHHIRKQNDSDVFNKVPGTTGLTVSADATLVMENEATVFEGELWRHLFVYDFVRNLMETSCGN